MEDKKLDINISPEVAEGKYANFAVISHSESEFVLDFISHMPHMAEAKVQSRIIMSPTAVRRLHAALTDNIGKYEMSKEEDSFSEEEEPLMFKGPQGEA